LRFRDTVSPVSTPVDRSDHHVAWLAHGMNRLRDAVRILNG
jgi:hypothetical protein